MTKSEATDILLNCEWLDEACKRIGKQNWEDLRQTFWTKILEQPDDVFTRIRDLRFFSIRIIMNANYDLGRYVKRGFLSDILNTRPILMSDDITEKIHIDFTELAAHVEYPCFDIEMVDTLTEKEQALGKLPFYDRVIFKLHEKGVSCRAIAKETQINRNEINATINRVKQYIAENVRYDRASN